MVNIFVIDEAIFGYLDMYKRKLKIDIQVPASSI